MRTYARTSEPLYFYPTPCTPAYSLADPDETKRPPQLGRAPVTVSSQQQLGTALRRISNLMNFRTWWAAAATATATATAMRTETGDGRRDGPLGWRVGLGGSLAVGRGAGR